MMRIYHFSKKSRTEVYSLPHGMASIQVHTQGTVGYMRQKLYRNYRLARKNFKLSPDDARTLAVGELMFSHIMFKPLTID